MSSIQSNYSKVNHNSFKATTTLSRKFKSFQRNVTLSYQTHRRRHYQSQYNPTKCQSTLPNTQQTFRANSTLQKSSKANTTKSKSIVVKLMQPQQKPFQVCQFITGFYGQLLQTPKGNTTTRLATLPNHTNPSKPSQAYQSFPGFWTSQLMVSCYRTTKGQYLNPIYLVS